jgi:tetratricopeptide (TPR) repeat protein
MTDMVSKILSATGLLPFMLLLGACSNDLEAAAQQAAMAEAQLAAGDVVGARVSIQKAIANRDDMAEYYIMLGRIEIQAQRPISAFNAYTLAQDLEADNQEILQSVADLGLQVGRLGPAEAAADRLLLLAPNATGAMLVKGFIAVDQNRLNDAAKIADEILQLNEQDAGGVILAARVDAMKGKPAEALKRIDAIRGKSAQSQALDQTRLEILRMQGNGEAMKQLFEELLRLPDGNPDYPLDYANLLYKMGETQKARRYLAERIAKAANNREQLQKITVIWQEHDGAPLVPAEIERFAESGTDVTRITLARYFIASKQASIAKKLLTGKARGRTMEIRSLLARAELALGERMSAYSLATDILEADRRNTDALLVRVDQNIKEI